MVPLIHPNTVVYKMLFQLNTDDNSSKRIIFSYKQELMQNYLLIDLSRPCLFTFLTLNKVKTGTENDH
jgi:hypothetical protein